MFLRVESPLTGLIFLYHKLMHSTVISGRYSLGILAEISYTEYISD
uniref:Uncharacterized protein n=1 Tax=Picea sitchensis TaxID=3332 RepID=D5ADG6_PICSI|nr:unknown [Picea sitchensis]